MEGEEQEEMGREKKWKERDKRRWEERRNGRRGTRGDGKREEMEGDRRKQQNMFMTSLIPRLQSRNEHETS